MKINEIEIIEYEAFEAIINIKLFNDVISFIMETTNIESKIVLNKLIREHIWFKRTINNNVQAEYGFRYLGELLERYEERVSTNIEDIRAIVLALAYSKDLINIDMIVGTQLIDFINKVYEISDNDIYLKGALYLYDNDKYLELFKELVNEKFETTEDIVFVLSLFSNIQEGFEMLQEQLIELLGKSKTISVMNNVGIYNWIIKRLYTIIKSNRKKGIELFKALISIPTTLVKQDSKIFNVLLENKYTKEEIAFLNYILIHYQAVPNCVRIRKSIVEEKIAIKCCKTLLNSETIFSDYIYDLISTILNKYKYFEIKCYGFEGILDAISSTVNIKIPQVFIKFYNKLSPSIHSFDILDKKWDIVQKGLDASEYEKLFDDYLQYYDYTKKEIEERIDKYDKLTNTSYKKTFYNYKYRRDVIFSILVEKDVICLQSFFEQYINQKEENKLDLQHLSEYVTGITTKKAFLFFRYFLNIKEYTIKDIEKFRFDIKCLYSSSSHYYYHSSGSLNIKRDFLSLDEQKEMFMWLEEYIFYMKSEEYIDFIVIFLKNNIALEIFNKEELRELYDIVSNIDDAAKNNKSLREKYLSMEELELLIKKEKEEEENKKLAEQQKKENEIVNAFKSIEDVSFKNIYKFCYSYRWQEEKTNICCKIVKQYLNANIESQNLTSEEIINFNKICNLLIQEEFITIDEFKKYMTKYIGNGELILCKE